jgi:hypothetical protein
VATKEYKREAAEVAAIPTVPPVRVPATIVFDPSPEPRAAWTIPGIEHAISKERFGTTLMQTDRPPEPGRPTAARAIASLPDEYLILKEGHASSFAKRLKSYANAGGPLELRLVGPQRDDLVAVWYRAFNPPPTNLPLLAMGGWYRGPSPQGGETTQDKEARIRAFLVKALTPGG